MSEDCIFCKIINGEIPSFKVYEDEETYAFMDINPVHDGHALVISKEHAPNLFDVSADALSATARTAQKVAKAVKRAVAPDGMNLLQCNGEAAAQSVFHFHMHVLPRKAGDEVPLNWGFKPGSLNEIGELAEKIRENMA